MEQYRNEGYIWLSDANVPIIIDDSNIAINGNEITISFGNYNAKVSDNKCSLLNGDTEVKIPFIIEALFVVDKVSYQVKFTDGKYIVFSRDLNAIAEYTPITYLPNRFGDKIKGLNFIRVWEARADQLCLDMEVLRPTVDLFVGFKK